MIFIIAKNIFQHLYINYLNDALILRRLISQCIIKVILSLPLFGSDIELHI